MTYLQCHQGFRGMGVGIFERPTSRLEQESVEVRLLLSRVRLSLLRERVYDVPKTPSRA
jgi:hypothetical protein